MHGSLFRGDHAQALEGRRGVGGGGKDYGYSEPRQA